MNSCLSHLQQTTNNKLNKLYSLQKSNNQQIEELTNQVTELEQKQIKYNETIQKNENIKQQKSQLELEKQQLLSLQEKQLAEQEYQNKYHEEKLSSFKQQFEQTKQYIMDMKEQIQSSLLDIDIDVYTLSEKIEQMTTDKKCYEEVEQHNKLVEENNKTIIAQQAEDKKQYKAICKQLSEIEQQLDNLSLSKEITSKTFPVYALEKIMNSIMSEINNIIEQIYDKKLDVNLIANKNSVKMNYNCEGRTLPVIKLSGAEQNIVDLAVQTVFNNMQQLNCIILDEIDCFASEQTALLMADCITNLSSLFEQLIIITHKQELKQKLTQNQCNIIDLN